MGEPNIDNFIGYDADDRPLFDCWDCGGEGIVEQATSDDPCDDQTVTCRTCGGSGLVVGESDDERRARRPA